VEQLFPLVLLALAFVLLIVLPARQRKKMQANAQALQESLSVGTPVMLTSGIHGTVVGLGEGTVDLQIAAGVVITVARPAIMEVRTTAAGPGATGTSPGFVDGDPTDPTR
jgi:preprotein translocase subunit YajC